MLAFQDDYLDVLSSKQIQLRTQFLEDNQLEIEEMSLFRTIKKAFGRRMDHEAIYAALLVLPRILNSQEYDVKILEISSHLLHLEISSKHIQHSHEFLEGMSESIQQT